MKKNEKQFNECVALSGHISDCDLNNKIFRMEYHLVHELRSEVKVGSLFSILHKPF